MLSIESTQATGESVYTPYQSVNGIDAAAAACRCDITIMEPYLLMSDWIEWKVWWMSERISLSL